MSKKLISFYKNTLFIFYSIFQYESRAVIYTSIYMPIYFICIQYRHKNIVLKTYYTECGSEIFIHGLPVLHTDKK